MTSAHQEESRQRWADGEFDRAVWDAVVAEGILELVDPEDACATVTRFGAALEGMVRGSGDPGFGITLIAHALMGMALIGECAEPAVRDAWLRRLTSGREVLAFAVTEKHGGTDAFVPKVALSRDGVDYVLNGEKWHITNATVADVVMVLALDPERNEPVFVMLETTAPGVTVRPLAPGGTRTAPVGEFSFDHVRVPQQNVFGWGRARKLLSAALYRERLMTGFLAAGGIQWLLDQATRFAVTREVGGTLIAEHQHIQRRLCDIQLRLSIVRGLIREAVAKVAAGERYARQASELKLYAMRAGMESATDAIQIGGSYGVQEDAGLYQVLLDAMCATVAGGTEEAHRLVIMREIVREFSESRDV